MLCVTALGEDLEQARAAAYGGYDAIQWSGKFCRRDIGLPRTPAAPWGWTWTRPRTTPCWGWEAALASTEPTLAVVVPTSTRPRPCRGCCGRWDGPRAAGGPAGARALGGGRDHRGGRRQRRRDARPGRAPRRAGAALWARPRLQLAAGARLASAELLLFLHADTWVAPGSLERVRQAFGRPELVASGMRQRIDDRARIYRWIEGAANRRVGLGWVYGDSGLAVRRSVYEEVGGFAEQPLFEDLDLSRRLRRRGSIALVEGTELVVSARRWQEEGAVRRSVRNWLLTAAWALGVAPAQLERFYRPRGARGPAA